VIKFVEMGHADKVIAAIKCKLFIVSAALILALILIPIQIHNIHNHNFDGKDHPDCPVNKFLATYFVVFAIAVILLFLAYGFSSLSIPQINRLRLGVYYSPRAQRGPPATI
jgi:hypothetical protein